jgi:polyphosphate glucokinase
MPPVSLRCAWARVAGVTERCWSLPSARESAQRCSSTLGHLQVGSEEAEQRASARIRVERGLSWQAWAGEVNAVLAEMHRLLWPDLFIIGGGVTENWELFGPLLEHPAEIVVARYGNDAGLIGAAMAAVESGGVAA